MITTPTPHCAGVSFLANYELYSAERRTLFSRGSCLVADPPKTGPFAETPSSFHIPITDMPTARVSKRQVDTRRGFNEKQFIDGSGYVTEKLIFDRFQRENIQCAENRATHRKTIYQIISVLFMFYKQWGCPSKAHFHSDSPYLTLGQVINISNKSRLRCLMKPSGRVKMARAGAASAVGKRA